MSRTVCFMFTVLLTLTGLSLSAHVQPVQDSDLSTVPERLREFLLIRRLINNLHAAEAGQEIPAVVEDPTRIRKRTCYINAGLSHGCDYKDLVGAMAEKSYWDSLSSPGRRRRAAEVASGEYQASGSLELSEEAQ
ncbi:uncharacterized protein LOC122260814 isoform X2 [Penaeus japonicus]|uniref:uncharacterized protein LOC122260814 isoform X2 n=1 Tax=Penaeus japonicus TaxID=27405 RepID=UPI001C71513F|nr:uncharacterized protein LOC122260814 isoform X2 [Penaeus japonicus]